MTDAYRELATRLRIEPGYHDNWGNWHELSDGALRQIVSSLGIEDPWGYARELDHRPWNRLVEPVIAVYDDSVPISFPIHFPLTEGREHEVSVRWCVSDETGMRLSREFQGVTVAVTGEIPSGRYVRVELPLEPPPGIGYYEYAIRCATPEGDHEGRMLLIVAPRRCHVPPHRTWGITLNLYALRSGRNWGFGDLTDLRAALSLAHGALGAGFVGINPLHATPNRMPYGISPYSSTSRLFRSLLYIDVTRAPGYRACIGESMGLEIEALRASELLDYEGAARVKSEALGRCYEHFILEEADSSPLRGEFEEYVKAEGVALSDYATFMALERDISGQGGGPVRWQDWPREYMDPRSPAVESFREANRSSVEFHMYQQWVLDRQLADASRAGREMPVGLYMDLAVGSAGEGSDAWSYPESFAFGSSAGAPPDAFNQKGQNWGFPPFNPIRLREDGYALFIETIRRNLKYAGALRIDHALGLFKLFYIPDGYEAREGTFVGYNADELLKIITLESQRAQAVIIAEDLGTVSEEVRQALIAHSMLTYRLFYFEREWHSDMSYLRPERYPEMAFAAVTTHDLPTFKGFWAGRDLEVKGRLSLYPNDEMRQRDLAERVRDRQLMLDALSETLPDNHPRDAESVEELSGDMLRAVHVRLGRTPCLMVSVSLDDLTGALDQPNMPGTIDDHPNWRQRIPDDMEAVLGSAAAISIAGALNVLRGPGR